MVLVYRGESKTSLPMLPGVFNITPSGEMLPIKRGMVDVFNPDGIFLFLFDVLHRYEMRDPIFLEYHQGSEYNFKRAHIRLKSELYQFGSKPQIYLNKNRVAQLNDCHPFSYAKFDDEHEFIYVFPDARIIYHANKHSVEKLVKVVLDQVLEEGRKTQSMERDAIFKTGYLREVIENLRTILANKE